MNSNADCSISGPLAGIKVIDLSRVLAGPYCTMQLLDLGAEVIKVEHPDGGDEARHFGPFVNHHSAYFASLNRGKKSIALDLKKTEDRVIFEDLLTDADVLVENFRAGAMEKLGFGWEVLKEKYPRLIYAAISGFGQTGSYKNRAAYDMVVQGMGGVLSLTGHPGGPPTRVGTSVGDLTAALFALSAINAALFRREQTGHGDMIDISMLDCQVAILENAIARYFAKGEIPGPLGARHPSITPFEVYEAQDGYIIIAAGNNGLFSKLCKALDQNNLVNDEKFLNNDLRNQHAEDLKHALEKSLKQKPTAYWLDVLETAGVPCGPINNVEQVVTDMQVVERNMIVDCNDPDMGSLKMAGNPMKFSNHPDPTQRPAVPGLDQNRQQILSSS